MRLVVGAITALLLVTTLPTSVSALSVSIPPATWTPSLVDTNGDASFEQVRQLVPCGGMMYAVGTFTQITQGGTVYDRNNAFSFNATNGAVSGWNPNVNGPVNSVALSAGCETAYLGGVFTQVGTDTTNPPKNIAAVDTVTGTTVSPAFRSANGQVSTLLVSGPRLLVGGFFTSINGTPQEYLASLDAVTGAGDGYVSGLNISGTYEFVQEDGKESVPAPTRIHNFALSPDGKKLLAMGTFTTVGGRARRQIFMLDLGPAVATVNPWYSTEFNQNCEYRYPFWLRDASWAPDGTTIYTATTGFKPAAGPGFDPTEPRAGLCDSLAAFPTALSPTGGSVTHKWVSYSGCDSLFSTAADSTTVYAGGHQRWMNNSKGCGFRGLGAVGTPGLAGHSPSNGAVTFNPTRARGRGAEDMVVTDKGLWIASDNLEGSNSCGGVTGLAGICFLPNAKATARSDYNGDGRADNAVWRPSNGTWYVLGSVPVQWGQSGDMRQVGNFTGDGRPDPTVWRPSSGNWYVKGVAGSTQWGASSDKPVYGDYDADGLTDFAVWRPSNGTWYVHPDKVGTPFGASGDIPVPGDYAGDAKTDLAVWRPSTGEWFIRANGVNQAPVRFGQSGDRPIVADFDGDGRVDITVWRPSNGTWYVIGKPAVQWGFPTDVPVAGDYTGDGKADITAWRPSNGYWYLASRLPTPTQWGKSGDLPLQAFP